MTRLAAYQEYRVWGGSWLSVVPKHWRTASLRHFASFSTGWTPPTDDDTGYDGDHLWANISDLGGCWIDTTKKTIGDTAILGRKVSEPGDLLFSFKLSVGTVSRVSEKMYTNEAIATFSPSGRLDLGYAYYALPVFVPMNANTNIYGAQLLNASLIRGAQFAAPPLTEQRVVAAFLDRETAQIDSLIGKQEQLIATLRERRAAVVSYACSTLSSERVHLRRLVRFLTSGSRGWGDYYADKGERFLRIGNLPRKDLTLRGNVQYVDLPESANEGERTKLKAGDLLFSITAYLGSVAVVDEEWIGAYVSQHVALCRLDASHVDPHFIGWFMLSREGQEQLQQGAAGGTKLQLALPDIRELRVPLPPVDEQRRIVAHLDEQTAKIDALIGKAERFIELAKERRAALITAAVTGQIDVRTITTSVREGV